MKNVLPILLIAFLIVSCSKPKQEENKLKLPPISEVYNSFYEGSLALYPLTGNFLGINRYYDTLPNNLSIDFREKEIKHYQLHLDKIQQYDRMYLSISEQLNCDIIIWISKNALDFDHSYVRYLPINHFYSTNLTIGQIASGSSIQPFNTVEDYENWLKRLEDYTVWLDSAMVNMKKGVSLGYVHPTSIVKKIIPHFSEMANTPLEEHLFYTPIKNMPEDFSEEDKSVIVAKYSTMIQNELISRYKKSSNYLQNEYLDASRSTSGIGSLPFATKHYRNQIKIMTDTELSPDSIFSLGKSEVDRIQKEMEKVKTELGFEGSLRDFFDHVRNNKELMPFKEPQEVIEHFNEIHDRMKPNLEKLFALKPKTPFEVKRVEAFREKSTSAHYTPGNPDGSRPGVFYVPIPDVESYNIHADEDLFLHEAIPGHHYQLMLALENENIPSFRKFTGSGAYIEGWALYSESLGIELGLYDDPYQYFGMLSGEIHRAIRLVVDVGLHHKEWTREEAIQYSLDHEAESEASIVSEIERYMVWPAQALSYKIGQLTILSLRKEAEEALKEKFDVKIFHSIILEAGDLPLYVLQKKVRDWIEESTMKK